MTPGEFAAKWAGSTRQERAAAQEHSIDLCRMLHVATPNEADPDGGRYAFEKGAEKLDGGEGWADNDHPQWLVDVHGPLDQAVLAACGWPPDLPDGEILERLLALNLERGPNVTRAARRSPTP